jgi:hypothetical protein
MFVYERPECLRAKQRAIATEYQRLAFEVRQMFPAAHYRVGGSQLLVLLDPDDILGVGELALHLLAGKADHDKNLLYTDFTASLQHISEHGSTADLMQHLRALRIHPRAATSRQNYRYRLSHW